MKREYEIGFIINPETADDEAEKIKTSITDILEKGEGTIENVDDWGRKSLAYPIDNHKEGIYVFIKTMAPGNVIATVERRLKLNEKVMRFIVIRLDDKFKKTNKLEKKWKRIERFSRKSAESDRERPTSRPSSATSEVKTSKGPEPATPIKKEVTKKPDSEEKTVTEPEIKEKKKEEKIEKPVEKIETKSDKESEVKNEVKEKKTEEPVVEEKKEEIEKIDKKEKESEKKKETEKPSEEKQVKPKKAPAKKTTKKTEEKVSEEAENAETK